MRNIWIIFFAAALAQCNTRDPHDPSGFLRRDEQRHMIYKTIRYSAKLPPNSNHDTKFDTAFDAYYNKAAADYTLMKLHKRPDGSFDFLLSRPARSITPMYEGIGGQLMLDDKDSLIIYNEEFRTWKMPYEDLVQRGSFLFDRMVRGEDLTTFYAKNAGDQYIEFPDDRFTFDKKKRRWHDSAFDTIR